MDFSVVVLNWNGCALLAECLPSVKAAAEAYTDGASEIIVVDNGSSDGSREYVRNNFPDVRFLALEKNYGFACAMNRGIREARNSRVVCLNNDVVVRRDFIAPLARHFRDNSVFCCGAKMLLPDATTLAFGRAQGSFCCGFFLRTISDSAAAVDSLYGCAGGMMLDREKFLKLGGFDEEMAIYWEDLDLCYRAWKQGWRTLYEPSSVLLHKLHATNSVLMGKNAIDRQSGRNYLLFIVKNIHDPLFFLTQTVSFPFFLLLLAVSGKAYFALGMLKGCARAPGFLRKRKQLRRAAVLNDRQVLRQACAV
jgi:GT2 family glycosyltransferase